ncbi:MAG: hypothetical protein F6K19_37625 [Cyanothece sp. SIO1E1]|nr:hypothetical protein [Cyanothece sp. SIO1E1]
MQRISALKLVSSITIILAMACNQPIQAKELLFDRGLPSQNLNAYEGRFPATRRSNLRWGGGSDDGHFSGDNFIIGNPGERYFINHIRTWVALGYREDGPQEPADVGDWFSQLRLLGGAASDEKLSVLASGNLELNNSRTDNVDVFLSRVTYPNERGDIYENFGPRISLWQIDFYNLNWVVDGGKRYDFSVQGVGRQYLDTDYAHVWYNHASNAEFSGTPQEAADGLILIFTQDGEFLDWQDTSKETWDKSADLNIQIFGEALKPLQPLVAETSSDTLNLVEIVENLNAAHLLTGKQFSKALIETEHGQIQLRSHLLEYVDEEALAHFFEEENIPPESIVQFASLAPVTDEQIADLQSSLDQLNETGVLSDRVYNRLQNDITIEYIDSLSLYSQAIEYMRLHEKLQPDLVEPNLNQLHKANIISHDNRTALLQALENEELENPIEFLHYIDQALLFDFNDYSPDPYEYFPAIHQDIAQMLVDIGAIEVELDQFLLDLTVTEEHEFVRWSLENEGESSSKTIHFYDALMTVLVDGREYKHTSFYATPISERDFQSRIDSFEFIHLFNKILRDQRSPYRLDQIRTYDNEIGSFVDDYSRFGIIALTEEQAKVYVGDGSRVDYESSLTSDRIEEIIQLSDDIGLFSHLTQAQIAAGREKIARSYITSPYQILEAFEAVILIVEAESGNIDNPYQALTHNLAAISRGNFAPTDITNEFDWDARTAGQSFQLNGTRHNTKLEFAGDWLDFNFFTFIHSVVETEVANGKFYCLHKEYEEVQYIFLTKKQFNALKSHELRAHLSVVGEVF